MKIASPSSILSVVLALFISPLRTDAEIILQTRLTSAVVGVEASRDGLGNIFADDTKNFTADFSAQTLTASKAINGDQATSNGDATGSGQLTLDAALDALDLSGSGSSRASANANSQPGQLRFSQASAGSHGMSVGFELTGHSYTYTITGNVTAGGDNGTGSVSLSSASGSQVVFQIQADDGTESKDFSESGTLPPGRWQIFISNNSTATAGGTHADDPLSQSSSASVNCVFKLGALPPTPSTITWLFPVNGNFSNASQWDTQRVPGSADAAHFTRPGTYTVNIGTAATIRAVINRSRVTFANANYTLGTISPEEPSLIVENGGRLSLDSGTLRAVHASIGDDFTSSGGSQLTVRNGGSHFEASGSVRIGGDGSGGFLSVQTGGTAITGAVILGGLEESVARVDGGGATWQTGNFQIFGFNTKLFVLDGGHLTSGTVLVQAATRPLLRVEGVGSDTVSSRWDMQGLANDDADIQILDGAFVTASSIQLGQLSQRTGTITVSGVRPAQIRPSQLDVGTSISIGGLGKGKLSIMDGGFVSTLGDVVLAGLRDPATNQQGRGDIVVDGLNAATNKFSKLQVEGKLQVGTGVNGTGEVTILNGAEVECRDAQIGVAIGSFGGVTVNSSAQHLSNFKVTGDLTVGLAGSTGVIALTDGFVQVGGNIHVSASGSIIGTGHVLAGGTITISPFGFISPGLSPGILTLEGNLILEAGAVINSEVAGPTPGKQADQLIVTGDATLNGVVKLQFMNGYAPKAGDLFQFFKVSGTTTGDFASFVVSGLAPGAQFQTALSNGVYTATALNDAAPLPTVSIHAVTKKAFEKGGRSAALLISRKGSKASKANPLTVAYTIRGTAGNGTDYTSLTGSVTIPARKNAVTIKLQPFDDSELEGRETVEFTVIPGADYSHSLRSKAQVTIVDNERAER